MCLFLYKIFSFGLRIEKKKSHIFLTYLTSRTTSCEAKPGDGSKLFKIDILEKIIIERKISKNSQTSLG